MRPGQRPQKHVRVIHGNATLVNDDVPPPVPTPTDRKASDGASAGLAQLVTDDTEAGVRVSYVKLSQFDPDGTSEGIWEVRNSINPATGEGNLVVSGDGVSTIQTHEQRIGPGVEISNKAFTSNMDYSGANLTNAIIKAGEMVNSRFDGATLDGVVVGAEAKLTELVTNQVKMTHTSFRGASLRGAKICSFTLSGVDFTGADMTGMEFWGMFRAEGGWAIDVTDSNFHPNMLGSEGAVEAPTHHQSLHRVKYTRYSLEDVAELTGIPEDDLAMAVWAGDLEIRDNETLEVVTGAYNKDSHHIPQWGIKFDT